MVSTLLYIVHKIGKVLIKDNSVLKQEYVTEVGMLAELSVKNITGVITTNYDSFIAICSIFVHSFLFSPDHKFLL